MWFPDLSKKAFEAFNPFSELISASKHATVKNRTHSE